MYDYKDLFFYCSCLFYLSLQPKQRVLLPFYCIANKRIFSYFSFEELVHTWKK